MTRARPPWSSWWSTLASSALSGPDFLFLGYLTALLVGTARRPDLFASRCAVVAIAALLIALAQLSRHSHFGRIVHDFDPAFAVIACFNVAGPLVGAINHARWDEALAALDHRWFGVIRAAWFGVLGRPGWLTDFVSLVYVSFYAVPLAIMIALHRRKDRHAFDRFVVTATAAFVANWILYIAVPAAGPRITTPIADVVVGGGMISHVVRAFLRHVEWYELDAFPSGHTALSVVYAVAGARELPRWRVPLGLIAILTVFSTVYLSQHYVVDVVAGLALAAAVLSIRIAYTSHEHRLGA